MNILGNKDCVKHKGKSPNNPVKKTGSLMLIPVFCLCLVLVYPSAVKADQDLRSETVSKASDMDPFLAGALGMIPLASGFYVTESPVSGLVFTLVDALLVMGMYTSHYTERGDPSDVKYYFVLMGANNILDAWMSGRQVVKQRSLQSRISWLPGSGVQYALRWKF